MIPSMPNDNVNTDIELIDNIKRVIDYSGLNYYEVLDLPSDLFQLMLKKSIIKYYQSTEEGRQYLEDCKIYNTTEPDLNGLQRGGILK